MGRKDRQKGRRKRLKMRAGIYTALWILPLMLLAVLVVGVNVAASFAAPTLDAFVGTGKASYEKADGSKAEQTSYYAADAADAAAAKENSEKVAEEVSDEGIVLLKDDGTLPLHKGSRVTAFGYAFLNPAYSGTGAGSGGSKDCVTPEQALSAHFDLNDATVSAMKGAETKKLEEAQDTTPAYSTGILTSDSIIYSFDPQIYQGTEESCRDTDGIVFITRMGNEGADKKMDAYTDGTRHYLALSQDELDTIRFAKSNCRSVTVVIASSNPIEVAPLLSGDTEANAILWIGNPGSRGCASMGKVLDGEVNPSGRLVDTFATDLTSDPSFQNMGSFSYSDLSWSDFGGSDAAVNYYEYQEGLYSGYRYYETAAEEDPSFDYAGKVVYPFGYGLSYTKFDQSIADFDDSGSDVKVTVHVTNTGSTAGKDVVQVYASSPYTDFDRANAVEKPACELAGFGKTKLLEPGESQDIEVTFAKEDLASYSYRHDNGDGTFGCYLLEAGDYEISLRSNSHDVLDTRTVAVADTVTYAGSQKRSTDEIAATNQFQASDDYMTQESTLLTRADWADTLPKMAEGRTKAAGSYVRDLLSASRSELAASNGNLDATDTEAPVSGARNGILLSQLRGRSYDDPLWDELLDELDYTDPSLHQMLFAAGYQTAEVSSIGKPMSCEQDGDTGLKLLFKDTASWASKPVLASTWNVELASRAGAAFGQEALANGLTGWYVPGANIHRSAFGGRNFEYFSEDPVLSGNLAAGMISGAGDQGLACYMKHFALNDQETNRSNDVMTWADEQTMRELYLRPFEIAIKHATMHVSYQTQDGSIETAVLPAATGIMSAQNAIGVTPCYWNEALLRSVLRDEWGFKGTVITDLVYAHGQNLRNAMISAGGDDWLIPNVRHMWTDAADSQSPAAQQAMRRAAHDICYTVVNSSAMNGIGYGAKAVHATSPWVWLVRLVTAALLALFILIVRSIHKRRRLMKTSPELFRPSHHERKAARLASKASEAKN